MAIKAEQFIGSDVKLPQAAQAALQDLLTAYGIGGKLHVRATDEQVKKNIARAGRIISYLASGGRPSVVLSWGIGSTRWDVEPRPADGKITITQCRIVADKGQWTAAEGAALALLLTAKGKAKTPMCRAAVEVAQGKAPAPKGKGKGKGKRAPQAPAQAPADAPQAQG